MFIEISKQPPQSLTTHAGLSLSVYYLSTTTKTTMSMNEKSSMSELLKENVSLKCIVDLQNALDG